MLNSLCCISGLTEQGGLVALGPTEQVMAGGEMYKLLFKIISNQANAEGFSSNTEE